MPLKSNLRDSSGIVYPEAITPEMLTHGRELLSLNLIPELQPIPDQDPDWNNVAVTDIIKNNLTKLNKVRSRLIENYHG